MAFDLSTVSADLGSYLPSGNALMQNIALGAATSVVLAGLKSNAGKDALDPLGIFHGNQQQQANNPSAVVGPTITASAFAALPAATQAQLTAAGVHIVAG